jgi:hypothetical protein
MIQKKKIAIEKIKDQIWKKQIDERIDNFRLKG